MTAYLISDVGAVAPEEEEAWKAYLAVAPATIQKYGGRYLARGGAIDVIEGDWSPYAIVIAGTNKCATADDLRKSASPRKRSSVTEPQQVASFFKILRAAGELPAHQRRTIRQSGRF